MLLSDAITLYVARHRADMARTTLKSYGAWMRRFDRWLGGESQHNAMSQVACERFLRSLTSRPRTVKTALSALRSFGRWGIDEKLFRANPAADIPAPRLDPVRREVCTANEILDLLRACDRLPDARRGAQARAIVSVFAYTGLRRSELLALNMEDVNMPNRSLEVRAGKGNKARTAYPCEECCVAIREWLQYRGRCTHNGLWDFGGTRRLGHEGLKTLLEQVSAVAGYRDAKQFLPHSIRHFAATNALRKTHDIRVVQAMLGHASINTTAVYLHADEQRLRDVADLITIAPEAVVKTQTAPEPNRPADGRSAWRRRIRSRT